MPNVKQAQNVLRYVEVSSTLNKRAMEQLQAREAVEKRASAKVPGLVDRMLQLNLLRPTQKQAAAAALGSHDATMDLLEGALAKIADLQKAAAVKSAGDLGSASGESTGETLAASPFVGARTSALRQSDLTLLQRYGQTPGGA